MNPIQKMSVIGAATSFIMLVQGIYQKNIFWIITGLGFLLMFAVGYKDSANLKEKTAEGGSSE